MTSLILVIGAAHAADPALDGYEIVRADLTADHFDEARRDAATLSAGVTATIPALATAANQLTAATDPASARHAFGEMSRALVAWYSATGIVPEGIHTYHCPMTPDWPYWIQTSGGIANPYMGVAMPTCGEAVSFKSATKAVTP